VLSQVWPVLTEKEPSLEDADEWDGKEGKLELLEK
jgi:ferredoxin